MIKKLRIKFIFVNMGIVILMLTVIFGLVIYFTKNNLEQESFRILRSASSMPMRPDNPPEISEKINPSVFIIHQTPQETYRVTGTPTFDLSDEALVSELFETAVGSRKQTGVLKEYNLRFCVEISPKTKNVAFADISGEQTVLAQLVRTCGIIAVVSIGAFFVISFFLARWIVKPVETAWKQQKQFVADASHELKTPLTVIMTNAEMLQDNDQPEEKRMQFADNISVMSRQMRGLTENLLELARSDNDSENVILGSTDFSKVISDAVLPFEPLYYEKGLTLQSNIEDGITIKGDSIHLCRLADILLDNAMKYSYSGSTVILNVKKHGHFCILSVESRGDTISKTDLTNIFKRFYRIDKSRNANCSYGLGLSIAEQIANEHGGKLWAESRSNINTFYVKLPLISDAMK